MVICNICNIYYCIVYSDSVYCKTCYYYMAEYSYRL